MSLFLNEKTPLVAIDIGAHSVKLAQLVGSRNRFELLAFGMMPLGEETIVDGTIKEEDVVVDAVSKLIQAEKIQTRYAVTSVAGEAVIIKKIKVPMMTETELAGSINHEAEQYIPFDIDDVALAFQILGESGIGGSDLDEDEDEDKMDVLLVAVQREIIDARTAILEEAGLKPVVIDLDVFAGAKALSLSQDPANLGSIAIVDMGASFTHVSILLDGVSAFSQDIPKGGILSSLKMMSEFGVDYSEAEAIKRGEFPESVDQNRVIEIVKEGVEGVVEEVERSIEFYSSTSSTQLERIYLTGGGALTAGVDGLMSQRLNVPVEVLNPMDNIKISSRKFDRDMISKMGPQAAVAVGLATRKFDHKI